MGHSVAVPSSLEIFIYMEDNKEQSRVIVGFARCITKLSDVFLLLKIVFWAKIQTTHTSSNNRT